MEKERMAIGVRRPGWPGEIEFAVMRNGVGDRLMPILEERYSAKPLRVFADMIPEQRLMKAYNGVEFHEQARRAGVQRWVLHQWGQWQDDVVRPPNPVSLRDRWLQYTARNGDGRFQVWGAPLSVVGSDGIQRHCIMGMAIELFRADHPMSIVEVKTPCTDGAMGVEYYDMDTNLAPIKLASIPDLARLEIGLQDSSGSFRLTPAVCRVMGRYYGAPANQAAERLAIGHYNASLTTLNDRTRNWPMMAAIMEEPSAEVFIRS